MKIQLIDVKPNGSATYRVDNRLYEHKMAVTIKMIREANEDYKGSISDAKIEKHLKPTIAKFHPLKTRLI
jgi:hypothetical protein